jgi:hypothetical protein
MDLPDDILYLAETLVPPKPGLIVAIATERLVSGRSVPERAHEPLCVPEWRAFCHAVWHAEVPGPCKLITRHLGASTADGTRGSTGLPYCAKALTARARPIIEVDDAGMTQLGALHEIAHLLVDDDVPAGHRPRFIQKFVDLMSRWVSPKVAADWYAEWAAALRCEVEHEARPAGAAVCGGLS